PPDAGLPTHILSVSPEIGGLSWQNEVLSSDVPRDLAYVFGSPFDNHRIIRGTIPKNRRSFTIKASNPYPAKLLAEDFLRHMADAGVFVAGTIVEEKTNRNEFHQLFSTESPSL